MADVPSDNVDNAQIQAARYQYCLKPHFGDGVVRFQVVGPSYTPLDPQKKEIRLIKIDHTPKPGISFSFDLLKTSLDNCPSFTALSYVWNPKASSRGISCVAEDGNETSQSYEASENGNLSIALRHLRDDYQCDFVWADAICIDQKNFRERSDQVAQMHTIYRNARQVIGWLGGLDFLQPYVQQLKDWAEFQRSRRGVQEDPVWLQDANREASLLNDEFFLDGLPLGIMELDYWQRAWIFQEIAHAKEMRFAVGTELFTLQDLIDARRAWKERSMHVQMKEYVHNMNRRAKPEAKEHWPELPHPDLMRHYKLLGGSRSAKNMVDMVMKVRDKISPAASERISLEFFETFSRLSATDPRDYVFALWGFVDHNGPHVELLRPDYELDAASVFINAAKYFILAEESLKVLKCQSVGESQLKLPSWVPNWENAVDGSDRDTCGYVSKARDALNERFISTQDTKFSENVKIVDCHDQGVSLRVAGVQSATVVEVIGSRLLPFGHDNHHESLQNFLKHVLSGPIVGDRASLSHFIELLNLLADPSEEESFLDSLYSKLQFRGVWPDTLHPEFPPPGPPGSFEPSTYWADVMAASFLGASGTQESRTNLSSSLERELVDPSHRYIYQRTTGDDPEFNFFRTSDNSIGACHKMVDVQKGDVVCQFVVHPEVFILRGTENGYRPVGECLIPDVKAKELLDEVEWFQFY